MLHLAWWQWPFAIAGIVLSVSQGVLLIAWAISSVRGRLQRRNAPQP